MLTELRISNFGVIEQLAVRFGSGFIVFTGETGAGKSLLIDAVTLLVGGRASTDQIRAQSDEADLEAAFVLPSDHPLLHLLQTKEFARPGETDIVIRRVISRTGRNRTYLNGNLCPVHLLEELGGALVDVHGQHEQQSLLSSAAQLEALDAFGRLHALRQDYQVAYRSWQERVAERETLTVHIAQRREREDLLRFQFQEISDAAVEAGEDARLEQERPRLMHSQQLGDLSDQLHELLYAGDQGVLSLLASARKLLAKMVSIDRTAVEWTRVVEDAIVPLRDLADQIRHYRDQVEANPARLMEIEQRLDRLHRLSKKYGGSLDAMDLSRHHQVLCVTHLPQVGSQAHAHYLVEKQVRQQRTVTQVRLLTEREREEEVARMLAGVTVTNSARAAAAEMIGSAKERRARSD
ncbi:MAG: hypothetical protein E8D43_13855 [Nitrospira sp.]|nr:MAG: hypothetical protein E8D43_13855 [Nitrospira sp.]